MAQVDLFQYVPAPGVLHAIDARIKILIVALFIASTVRAAFWELAILSIMVTTFYLTARLSFLSLLKELNRFKLFFLILFLGSMIGVMNEEVPGPTIPIPDLAVYLGRGVFAIHTFILIITVSRIFIATTRSAEIRYAVEWFLRPVPFIQEKKAAIMLELMIGFFPLIFLSLDEIRTAARSRGLDTRKGLAERLKLIVIPLVETVLIRADEVTLSLVSRCFSETGTPVSRKLSTLDLVSAFCSGIPILCLLVV